MVRLKTWSSDSTLFISIEDDGVGIPEEKLGTLLQQGIGVSNGNERLRVLFGRSYRLIIDSKPGQGTQTVIEIPELDDQLVAMTLPATESV
jgi:sensor histidine kinase YesM